ncbi:MAG: sporulation protein YabP [Clostridia bacterium]|nr:sporulation protein YabP [Clostridia bacterium]
MNESEELIKHDITVRSRRRTEMTGISDVTSFDDGTIVAQSDKFGISIEGENLKIERFDAESGELIVNGKINGIFYFTHSNQKKRKSIVDIFK